MQIFHGKIITCDKNNNVLNYLVENSGKIEYVGNELPSQYSNQSIKKLINKNVVVIVKKRKAKSLDSQLIILLKKIFIVAVSLALKNNQVNKTKIFVNNIEYKYLNKLLIFEYLNLVSIFLPFETTL